jgi:hypothetical protein
MSFDSDFSSNDFHDLTTIKIKHEIAIKEGVEFQICAAALKEREKF